MYERNAIRRVVTGHDDRSKSCVLIDGDVALQATPSGTAVCQLWVTDKAPASNDGGEDPTGRPLSLQPPPTGSLFWIITMPPASENADSRAAAHTMHATNTVDYLIVLSGTVQMHLDEGEVVLRQGDVLIQRGTTHSWKNVGTENAVLAVILVDAQPLVKQG